MPAIAPLDFTPCIEFETRIGEGAVWDDGRGVLWFVDILAPEILEFDPASGRCHHHPMPDLVTSVGLTAGEQLIISLRKEVAFYTPRTGQLETHCVLESDRPMNRLNDGKVGPDGALWIGSMHAERPYQPTAALWRVTPAGEATLVLDGLSVSNGLGFSPDNRRLYHADTRGFGVRVFDLDPQTGAVSDPMPFADPSEDEGLPDGAAVDICGNYWSAGVTAGCLNVYAPNGRKITSMAAGQRNPTMPCFGGTDGKTLFVTGLSRDGSRGTLVSARTETSGTPIARFGRPL